MADQTTILVRASEAAAKLGISKTTLHRYVKAGKIECIRFATNSIYFTQKQLDDYVDAHRTRYSPNRVRFDRN